MAHLPTLNVNAKVAKLEAGFSLLEINIGLVISLLLAAILLQFITFNTQLGYRLFAQQKLQQQLNHILLWMAGDLSRTGYWGEQALSNTTGAKNPFNHNLQLLRIAAKTSEESDSCILYSYNLDDDAEVGLCSKCLPKSAPFNNRHIYDKGNMEMFGLRLNNKKIQIRTGLRGNFDGSYSCNSGSWSALTDPKLIVISALEFQIEQQVQAQVTEIDKTYKLYKRFVTIRIKGHLRAYPEYEQELSSKLELRNDWLWRN